MNRSTTPTIAAQRGFSLLEAIVALTILGSSAVALMAWLQQSRDTLLRVERVRAEAQLQLDAQAWLATLNPSLNREGDADLGGLQVRWTSELIGAEHDENDFGGVLQPVWRIGLYRVQAQARRGDVNAQWTQTLAGWRMREGASLPARSP
ncbi:type II secretion system protein [Roseateles sp. DB2]|uniref:type II secretion system protein n=1 Tax=Roseateles sp. DB2 TaxID=3453717 RepID=UPI003EE87937